jgi:hypothetical protein
LDFNSPLGQFLANSNPKRDADQVGVLELNAGPFVAVVEQRVDAECEAPLIDIGGRFDLRGVGVIRPV